MSALKRSLSALLATPSAAPTVKRTKRMAKYPLYRSMTRHNATMSTRRRIIQNIAIDPSLGWKVNASNGYPDIMLAPALSSCSFWAASAIAYQPVLPGATDFTNLYDQYRIKKVNVELWYSANDSIVSQPTFPLPLVHVMNDYNSTASQSLDAYLEHPELKTYQLGKEKRISWSFVPRTRGDVLTDNAILSSSANNRAGLWIDTSSANIQYLGVRFYIDFLGIATAVNLGSVQFIVTYDMEFRYVK